MCKVAGIPPFHRSERRHRISSPPLPLPCRRRTPRPRCGRGRPSAGSAPRTACMPASSSTPSPWTATLRFSDEIRV
ncbi:hypothetical protein VPH35_010353 [Triticum aestivum]